MRLEPWLFSCAARNPVTIPAPTLRAQRPSFSLGTICALPWSRHATGSIPPATLGSTTNHVTKIWNVQLWAVCNQHPLPDLVLVQCWELVKQEQPKTCVCVCVCVCVREREREREACGHLVAHVSAWRFESLIPIGQDRTTRVPARAVLQIKQISLGNWSHGL
jgi:hypothetical protein